MKINLLAIEVPIGLYVILFLKTILNFLTFSLFFFRPRKNANLPQASATDQAATATAATMLASTAASAQAFSTQNSQEETSDDDQSSVSPGIVSTPLPSNHALERPHSNSLVPEIYAFYYYHP